MIPISRPTPFPLTVIPAKAGAQFWISEVKLDDTPLVRLALRAIHDANVRFGILPTQSSLRWDDEEWDFSRTYCIRVTESTLANF